MAQVTYIDLMRHGETQGGGRFNGSTDAPLSKDGWVQMQTAISHQRPDSIICSPLSRCADFAHSLQQEYRIPVQLDERIKEIHFGEWEGQTAEEIFNEDEEALTRYWENPTQYTPPGAESLFDFEKRVLSFWRDIITTEPKLNTTTQTNTDQSKMVLVIAHGGVIRLLLGHILQRPLRRILEINVTHASLHRIRLEQGQESCSVFVETQI